MKDWKKYIIEFFVIMLGILAAIQFENWNQDRNDREKEEILLNALHNEFLQNKEQLELVISNHTLSLNGIYKIYRLIDENKVSGNIDSLNRFLFHSTFDWTYNPSQGVINSLVNTSTFDIISNDSLRAIIISWSDIYLDYAEEEIQNREFTTKQQRPYYDKTFEVAKRVFRINNKLSELKNMTFINMLKRKETHLSQILNGRELRQIRQFIDDIIRLTKQDLTTD